MRIPLGNFDQVRVQNPVLTSQAPGGRDPVGQAVENLGRTGQALAERAQYYDEKQREEIQRKQDAMARAKAADNQLNYELQVKSASMDVQDKVRRGEIPYQEAHDAYTKAISGIDAPKPEGLDPALSQHFETGLKRIQAAGAFKVRASVAEAQDADFKSRFSQVLDKLGKLAGMPGSDIEAINKKAESFAPLAREAGLSEAQIQKDLQDFKDANWTNQATQRIDAAQNDVATLQGLRDELSKKDGTYAGRIDATKRTALLGKIATRIDMLNSRKQHAQDRADAAGERAIAQIDKQIASGIPATPEMWTQWAQTVNGTSSQKDFKDRVAQAELVQKVMSMPPAVQQEYIQKAEAKLQSQGGSVREKANLDRLKNALQENIKQLHTDPLLYNQAHMGDAIKPLDLQTLASPDAPQMIGAQLSHRAATIEAMRKQYGQEVPMKLLLPQESDMLATTLQKATPMDQTRLLHMISSSIHDPKIYGAVMGQIAPKAPVIAFAGMLAERNQSMVVGTHWFGQDDTVDSAKVAMTMLQGQQILAGKDKSSIAPKDTDFRSAFADATGDLFRGRPDAAATAMKAVRAYYVGKAAEEGDTSGEFDSSRLSDAIRATLGEPVDVNGNGNVLPPWGMSPDQFEQSSHDAFLQAAKAAGLPQQAVDRWDDYGLVQAGSDSYYVTLANGFLPGKNGEPLKITVSTGGTK